MSDYGHDYPVTIGMETEKLHVPLKAQRTQKKGIAMAKLNTSFQVFPSILEDGNNIAVVYTSWNELYNWRVTSYSPNSSTYQEVENENGEITVQTSGVWKD